MSEFGEVNPEKKEKDEKIIPRWLREIEDSYEVIQFEEGNGKYTINTQTFGIVDYFPKANKVLMRKTNDWHEQGLDWIVTNIIGRTDE